MPLGSLIAVKKSLKIIHVQGQSSDMDNQVSWNTEHGNRRGLILALCRRRTV